VKPATRVRVRRCGTAPGVRYWTVEHWIETDAHHHHQSLTGRASPSANSRPVVAYMPNP
jgi:hypothetical protein